MGGGRRRRRWEEEIAVMGGGMGGAAAAATTADAMTIELRRLRFTIWFSPSWLKALDQSDLKINFSHRTTITTILRNEYPLSVLTMILLYLVMFSIFLFTWNFLMAIMEVPFFKLERNRVEQLEKFYPNLICTQSLGHMAITLEHLHKQSVVIKQICKLFPQRRVSFSKIG
ncbi:hypothetical protein LOK49_LG09G01877 [Camellia lanceoleosa]|uniref:Uncharacterized protein n=1 Tax=Camellia lanceoleosa TaxID=1840588 RepID=A0ACC0GHI1_9ERIC|nr:hypothetical protein LOK49_LG09G01877 [Camellia lanceoleosa]